MELTGTRRTNQSTKRLPSKWTAAIFEKMRLRYGDLWTSRMGIEPAEVQAHMKEWGEQLGHLTVAQVKHGLTWEGKFPPNVMEFKAHAKTLSLDDYLPKRCGIGGCPGNADQFFTTKDGRQFVRCNRHHSDYLIQMGISSDSDAFKKQMAVEVEEQRIVGKEAYARQSLQRVRAFIRGLG